MTKQTAHNVEEFEASLSKSLQHDSNPVFVYFVAERDPKTNQSWCPDCQASDAVLAEITPKLTQPIKLLECPVKRAEYKGNPNYPFRTHSKVQLKAVPTFIRWTSEGPQKRLVEGECTASALLKMFSS
eukprot:TRINITY_DN575_c0_g1_i1.p1 TRINITY_DN575_c0_g1~~TRINITY_DN575_c0_g1_i1.p1  ORF type:complete len:128 (-),score=28.46 TRINITY_DN575_c0_g1_i1:130-513(-)